MLIRVLITLLVVSLPVIASAATFQNPLAFKVVHDMVRALVYGVIYVGTPAVVVYLMYSGFLFTAAQGNPDGLSRAKRTFIRALIITLLLFGLWSIVSLVSGTLADLSAAALLIVLAGFLAFVLFRG